VKNRAIAIGASTDGIAAISRIVAALPTDLAAPVFVVQHVGRRSSGQLPGILRNLTNLLVIAPEQGELIEPARIYVAPPDQHMVVHEGRIHLSRGPEENYTRPSVDVLFRSVALAYGAGSIGVVLTGYLSDGTVGLLAIKDRGGVAIVQDPCDAGVPGMPGSALAHVAIDHRCKLDDLAPLLARLVGEDPVDVPAREQLVIEDRIAAGRATTADVAALLATATRTTFRCPRCWHPLYALAEPRIRRYRCARGHAFTTASLGEAVDGSRPRAAPWA
jgi:two-component system chemotaxis response regulator CheB